MDIILNIKERLSIFEKFYDDIRIVDPIKKKVILNNLSEKCNNNLFDDNFSMLNCHEIWGKNSICTNCISKKAYIENDTFVKLEHNGGKIFLVIASPIEIKEKKYIVEILKDITNNGEFVDSSGETNYLDLNMKNIGDSLVKDYLTGVYNRRYINKRLSKDVERNLIECLPTTILMADIDLFKNINDTYGHLIGDRILIDFAAILEKNIRKNSDWVGRYGGEEFIIVLNNTYIEEGVKVAEQIRGLVEKMDFNYDDLNIKITASFGVYEVSKNEDVSDIIKNSDKKLYIAKMTGRNKTVF